MSAENIGKIAFFYLFAYSSWRFVFTHTVFQSYIPIYVSFCLLLFLFGLTLFKSIKKDLLLPDICALAWIPFVSYISIRFILNGSIENCTNWIIVLIILCIPSYIHIYDKIPFNFLIYSSLFLLVSILFQLFFQATFESIYFSLFTNTKQDEFIRLGYGYTGFSYQVGHSSMLLLQGELALLMMWFNKTKKNKFFIVLIFLMILGVFLTGKRANSALVCLIFCIALVLRNKINARNAVKLFCVFLALFFLLNYFISNASNYLDTPGLKRIASAILLIQNGNDLDLTRTYLKSAAIRGFEENPFWGIGPETFYLTIGDGLNVHNIYFQILCELGLVGFILFIIPLVINIISTIRLLYYTRDMSFLYPYVVYSFFVQLCFIIGGWSENLISGVSLYVGYSVAISLLIDCKKMKNQLNCSLQNNLLNQERTV